MSISTEQSGTLSHEDEFNDSITSDTPTLCEVELGFRQSTSTDIEAQQQSRPARSFFSFFNFVRTSGTSRANNQDVYSNYNDNSSQLEQQKQQPKKRFWKSLLGSEADNKEEDTKSDADTTFTVVDSDPSNETIASHSSPYQNRHEAWQTFKRVATSCYNEITRMVILFLKLFMGLVYILITVALTVLYIRYALKMAYIVCGNLFFSPFPIVDSISFMDVVEYILFNLCFLLLLGLLLFVSLEMCAYCIFVIYCVWGIL